MTEKYLTGVLLLSLIFLATCDSTDNEPVSFEEQILPIFMTRCINCHSSDASFGNLDLSSYESLMSGNNDHPDNLVVPGYPDQSLLYEAVANNEQTVLDYRMPKDGPYLSEANIQLIYDWIYQGAKDN